MLRGEELELLERGFAIYARNQHTPGFFLGHQLHGLVDTGDAARQHGDSVRGMRGIFWLPGQPVGEDDEADDQHDQQEDRSVEHETDESERAAEAMEVLRARIGILAAVYVDGLVQRLLRIRHCATQHREVLDRTGPIGNVLLSRVQA